MPQTQDTINTLLTDSSIHPEWRPILSHCLRKLDPFYLETLIIDTNWLPGKDKLLAAFRRDLQGCHFVLFGESPYPRPESANGIAFQDAAVNQLWSTTGLSKQVNRATSLRNIIKTALLAEGWLQTDADGRITQQMIARLDKSAFIQTITELFEHLHQSGFLMFNVTPVLHADRSPKIEADYWKPFVNCLLSEIKQIKNKLPSLILWGKIASQIDTLAAADDYPKIISEHPYNLSFIKNPVMLDLFSQIKILHAQH
ncbi:MAG: uracil-DNA glycosylase [Gammaproteobacteria bacterium]|nr:uracil-DNA glycosylase [Gammaproteobacteria bacterium]